MNKFFVGAALAAAGYFLYRLGFNVGHDENFDSHYNAGFTDGYDEGYMDAEDEAYDEGFHAGLDYESEEEKPDVPYPFDDQDEESELAEPVEFEHLMAAFDERFGNIGLPDYDDEFEIFVLTLD